MNDPHFRYITKMGKRHLACLGITCAFKVYSAAECRLGPWAPLLAHSERGFTYLSYYRPSAIVVVVVLQPSGADQYQPNSISVFVSSLPGLFFNMFSLSSVFQFHLALVTELLLTCSLKISIFIKASDRFCRGALSYGV